MKHFLAAAMLLIATNYLFAQEEKHPVELTKHSFAVTLLAPGLQYELKLAEKKSLAFYGSSGFYAIISSFNGLELGVAPYLQASYRKYYDRKKVKKDLKHNSGNYYGGFMLYSNREWRSENTFNDPTIATGVTWGIQRNYKSNIHFGINTMLGGYYSENDGIRGFINADFQIGFLIK